MSLRADRLKARRNELGLTQEDVADRAGIKLRAVQRYEAGQMEPALDTGAKLATALATTVGYLAGETDDPLPQLSFADLDADERALIVALRNRQVGEAIQAFATLSKNG